MLEENAIIQLPPVSVSVAPAELARALSAILSNDSLRRDMGQRALLVCDRNRGATERTLRMIESLLQTPAGESIPFPALSVTTAE
jgi:3-deoxy-D-manno-octulosonic-acid transferase